ncbi:MAG: cupin domain-containing protein [OM182 bacterium]|jgi:hypothetical protein|nr:cupin domain-containing protein [OM182 bacterium]
MVNIVAKNFDKDGTHSQKPHASVSVVDLISAKATRLTVEPGWRWSTDIAPLAGTKMCEVHHLGFIASGTITVSHSGQEVTYSAGEVYEINPGHDAWVVGTTPAVAYEFAGSWA